MRFFDWVLPAMSYVASAQSIKFESSRTDLIASRTPSPTTTTSSPSLPAGGACFRSAAGFGAATGFGAAAPAVCDGFVAAADVVTLLARGSSRTCRAVPDAWQGATERN